jgi:histidine triad (HIT) family protein
MCLFCKIANKEIPSKGVFEDEEVYAFHDSNPTAPTHILVIPKRHIGGLGDAAPADQALLGKLLLSAHRVAHEAGVAVTGYRVVINNGPHAGQSVFHVHAHVIGGRPMGWPPF